MAIADGISFTSSEKMFLVDDSNINSVDNVYDILVHVEPAGKCQTGEKFGVDKDMV